MNEMDPKLRAIGIALGVLVLALTALDFVVLKGDRVAGGSLSLRSDATPISLTISRPHEAHLVAISTRKRVKGESVGQSISYRLVDPQGETVVEDSEIVSHKKRFFEFVPAQAGDYQLFARETTLIGSGRGSASVSVTVNDRRILSRLLGF